MIASEVFDKITQAETLGAAAFLLGALNALEAVKAAQGEEGEKTPAACGVLRDANTGRAIGLTCRRANDEEENDEEEVPENLADIDEALEKARAVKDFAKVRKMIVAKLWEPNIRAGVFDRFAAAIVLSVVTKETTRNILGAVENWKKNNPGFVAYPFLTNRLRAAFRAAGYDYPKVYGALEPAPQKVPFEKTPVGRAIARLEAGGR